MDSVLRPLAETYPQLYLTPGEEGAALYRGIVGRGEDAPARSLDHFRGSPRDSVTTETTPAGEVQIVTLGDRQDFELFLQIMGNRCLPEEIPATQGASILDGVINWPKIRKHEEEYRDALIVLSTGPYSAVRAEEAGLGEEAWLDASYRIRKAHECTHFICRRLYPDRINAIWDELVADAVGLYAAFGRYDLRLAERFLGVGPEGYTGGRLENYAGDADLNELSKKVHRTLLHLEKVILGEGKTEPYALALRLEEEIPVWTDGAGAGNR